MLKFENDSIIVETTNFELDNQLIFDIFNLCKLAKKGSFSKCEKTVFVSGYDDVVESCVDLHLSILGKTIRAIQIEPDHIYVDMAYYEDLEKGLAYYIWNNRYCSKFDNKSINLAKQVLVDYGELVNGGD